MAFDPFSLALAAAPAIFGLFGKKQQAPDYMGMYRNYIAGLDPIMDDPTQHAVYQNIESALAEQARLGLSEGSHKIADAYSARGLGQSGMLGRDMSRMVTETEAAKAGTMAQTGQNIWQTDVDRRLRQEAMGAQMFGVQGSADAGYSSLEAKRQEQTGKAWGDFLTKSQKILGRPSLDLTPPNIKPITFSNNSNNQFTNSSTTFDWRKRGKLK